MVDRYLLSSRPRARHAVSLLAVFLAVGCAHPGDPARPATEESTGYLTTSDNRIVRSGTDECVRTGSWQSRHATPECDPALVAQAQPPLPEPPAERPAAPAEQAPAPEPQPPVQAEIEPAPSPSTPVYIGADAFFGFNEAELSAQARRALDRVAERASDAEGANIHVVGHADQVGSEAYNLSLSQRRAETVHGYLVERGVPPSAVSVEARGESDPVVSCEGREGEALIDCLQPNRRTEIELSLIEPPSER